MKKLLLAIAFSAPLAAVTTPASAYPWSYSGYSSPQLSYYSINGPGGYSGNGYAVPLGGNGAMATYTDSDGSTSCYAIGNFISCY
jgi:hypothetical protein